MKIHNTFTSVFIHNTFHKDTKSLKWNISKNTKNSVKSE